VNQQQRKHEIDMMWRQLGEYGVQQAGDYLDVNRLVVRLCQSTTGFRDRKQIHAFLSGALEVTRFLDYQKEREHDETN